MVATELDINDVKRRLADGCSAIIAAKDRLTKADQATGDGDHGVGMARGFTAALAKLDEKQAESVGDLFKTIGMAIMSTSGGASGAVFGTFFMQAAGPLHTATLDAQQFIAGMQAGLSAVEKRGGAKAGDKTVIDALIPAIERAQEVSKDDVVACLSAAASGAAEGVAATVNMLAATGKARSLGERSIGHPDPGAITMTVFLEAFAGQPAPSDTGQTG
jgi:dihydroxyacetone kinase-like protein